MWGSPCGERLPTWCTEGEFDNGGCESLAADSAGTGSDLKCNSESAGGFGSRMRPSHVRLYILRVYSTPRMRSSKPETLGWTFHSWMGRATVGVRGKMLAPTRDTTLLEDQQCMKNKTQLYLIIQASKELVVRKAGPRQCTNTPQLNVTDIPGEQTMSAA